jgi:dTDP-4-dehydrorhamnose reductase
MTKKNEAHSIGPGSTGERGILLLGRTGQTGWELQRSLATLGRVVALARDDVDMANGAALRRAVREHSPALIVNATAYNAVDRAEQEENLATAVNGEAPGILAEEARTLGAALVHYSSDYVFGSTVYLRPDGSPRPFTEADPPGPLGAYGRSKLAGEEAIRAVGCAHLIFRTSWVYGRRGRSFLASLLRLEVSGEELRIVNDQVSSPTWARSLADATAQVLATCWTNGGAEGLAAKAGTFHLAGQGSISRYGFADAVFSYHAERDRRVPRVMPIPTADFPALAARPAYSALDSRRVREVFGIGLPDWRAGLALCLTE